MIRSALLTNLQIDLGVSENYPRHDDVDVGMEFKIVTDFLHDGWYGLSFDFAGKARLRFFFGPGHNSESEGHFDCKTELPCSFLNPSLCVGNF